MIGAASRVAAVSLLVLATYGPGVLSAPQVATQPVSFFELESRVPATWARQEPLSSMRLLQMSVPGEAPDAEAELIVFFFGPGQGGDAEANIERWSGQFSTAEGQPVEPRIEAFEVSGFPATLAELTGTYRRGMGGATGEPLPDQTLVAAIVETERGSLFVQLHGPAQTVAAQHAAFDAFLSGLQPLR